MFVSFKPLFIKYGVISSQHSIFTNKELEITLEELFATDSDSIKRLATKYYNKLRVCIETYSKMLNCGIVIGEATKNGLQGMS